MDTPTLRELGTRYGTDKVLHQYVDFYPRFMEPYRDQPIHLMEIGVFYGASLRMWRDYFPSGEIHGVDWFRGRQGNGATFPDAERFLRDAPTLSRVVLHECDQGSRRSLEALAAALQREQRRFQFIIDDGSHLVTDQQQTLALLWPFVAPGGAFIVEDIACSEDLRYADVLPDFSNTTLTLLREFQRTGRLRSNYMMIGEMAQLQREIERVEFFFANQGGSGAAVLHKRARAPRLQPQRHNVYSQNGEDGVCAQLLERGILRPEGVCVELGAWDGVHLSNTFRLVRECGYHAYYIEGDAERFQALRATAAQHRNIRPIHAFASADPASERALEALLRRAGCPREIDVLSIDVDGEDYALFESLQELSPRVVIVEVNSAYPPGVELTHRPPRVQGSSFSAMLKLGRQKGYRFLCHTGNMFFLRADLVDEGLIDPRLELRPELAFDASWLP